MAPDGQDGQTDGRKDGHGKTYIPSPSAGDKNRKREVVSAKLGNRKYQTGKQKF